ncbi:zinc ribbon domain-containing protein [Oceanobacillus kapialis]|uniref:Zinc ribbon domain-containing protein n=1 Tax=Oceanobacillus kapialis TaxID=481353 RepID=A0ABW5Q5I2_9BACI
MKCDQCNAQFDSKNKNFCPECGADLSEQREKESVRKKKAKKKTLILGIPILVVIAVITTFFFIGKGKFTPEKTLTAFEEAVEQEDTSRLASLLISTQDSFEITEDNVARFITYLKDNPAAYEELLSKLNSQVEIINSNSDGNNGTAYLDDVYGTVNITKSGKEWFLFDGYQLQVIPSFVKLNTKNKDVQLLINGEVAGKSDKEDFSDTYGPLMPGAYEVTASYKNDYSEVENTHVMELFNLGQDTMEQSFQLPLGEITVESLLDGYTLAVNGEKTDIQIEEGEQQIGTFPTDGSVAFSFHKEFPWGEVSSDEQAVESDYIGLDTVNALTPDMQTSIMEQLNTTISEYHQALTKKDTSIMKTGVTDNMKQSLVERQKEVEKEEPGYEGKLIQAIYDLEEISNPKFNEDMDAYTITMRAHYVFHEPVDSLGWLLADREKDEYTRPRELQLIYDEEAEQWKLDSYKNEYFIITSSDEKVFDL